jgi:hypothetical protein
MKSIKYTILVAFLFFSFCSPSNSNIVVKTPLNNSIVKLDMFLSAFGVESDGFPYIKASVDFVTNSASCYVWYDNPKFKDTTYSLDLKEIDSIKLLLTSCNLRELKKEYTFGPTDQPTSTTTIYKAQDTFYIKDYSLQGDTPLPDLYRIVYKLNKNYR